VTHRLADAGASVSCAFNRAQVAPLRQLVATYAQDSGLPGAREQDFVLAVDECLTNAIRHGGGGGWLRVWTDNGHICFRVTDGGSGFEGRHPHQAPPEPQLPGGRGLWIAQQLTDSMTIISGPDGTTVEGRMAVATSGMNS
jgi:anti-sigma regulatory factor (Ser/Thr protein kinase)